MENLNRIKGALVDAGKIGIWLACQLGKETVMVSKWCYQHHTTRFVDTGKDFGYTTSKY